MKEHGSEIEMRCERCSAVLDVGWVEVTGFGEVAPRYVAGRSVCPTAGCGTTCPICHRSPGDIHSGECAPIVAAKLVDRVWVTAEDCLTVAGAW